MQDSRTDPFRWSCSRCTLANENGLAACGACSAPRKQVTSIVDLLNTKGYLRSSVPQNDVREAVKVAIGSSSPRQHEDSASVVPALYQCTVCFEIAVSPPYLCPQRRGLRRHIVCVDCFPKLRPRKCTFRSIPPKNLNFVRYFFHYFFLK